MPDHPAVRRPAPRGRWRATTLAAGAALALSLLAPATLAAGDGPAAPPAVPAGDPVPDDARPEVTVVAPEARPSTVVVPTDPVPLGEVGATVRFEGAAGVALELADGRRLLDTVEVALVGDGQRLVNELSLDDYVAGIAEVPPSWHVEALKAQAVAARTYAWHLIELGTFGGRGFDVCDTIDCQVFRGAAQEEAEGGERWRAAVDATAGQVLVDDDGAPILARYFSTSGGRTLPNEVVFPSSGPRPYLTGTDDPFDAVSPFHRWEVTFTREEFDAITGAGDTLAGVTPVADVERLGPTDLPDAELRFTGADGATATLGSVAFRRFVSEVAPSRFPDRFPSARADGLRPLPATVPSSRFEVEVADDEVVVRGLGWGHAVGMGQYGALGRARDGQTYDQILAAYYAGLRPQVSDAAPERVRVGLSRSALGSVRGDAPVRIVADGETVAEAAAGTWITGRAGDRVTLTAPPGWGDPAEVSSTAVTTALPAGVHAVAVAATTATPGAAALVVRDAAGELVADVALGATDAGPLVARWDLRDGAGERVPAGTYAVALEVTAADGSVDGAPLTVEVAWALAPGGDLRDGATWLPWAVLAAVLVAGVGLVARRRRLLRSPSPGVSGSEPAGQE